MQHMIAVDVVRERERHALSHAAQNDGHAGDATRRVAPQLIDELFRRLANLQPNRVHDLLALAPSQHEERDDEGDQQAEPAAVEELGRGRGEEEQVEREKAGVDRIDDQRIVLPVQRNEGRHQRGDHHQERHCDAERAGQRVRRAEADDGRERAGGQRPVDERDIDLANLAALGMDYFHARQKAETDGLLRHRIGAGNDRLRRDHGRHGRQNDKRIVRPLRGKRVERAINDGGGIWLSEQQAGVRHG